MDGSVTVIDIIAQVTDNTAAGARSATSSVSKLETAMKKAQSEISKMKGMSKLEIAMHLKDLASKGLQSIANAGKKLAGKVWSVTLKLKDLVTAPFRGIAQLLSSPLTAMATITGVSVGFGSMLDDFMSFEQGMADVQSILQTTDEGFKTLSDTAKRLGTETRYSASEAANAMEELARAGWNTEQILSGIEGMLGLAAAGNVDLATAARITSATLAQLVWTRIKRHA